MTPFGIDEAILNSLTTTLAACSDVNRAVIFGSRATGSFRNHSDIDVAIYAPTLPWNDFLLLRSRIDDLPCIFSIDLVHVETLTNEMLRSKIKQDGKIIYQKTN